MSEHLTSLNEAYQEVLEQRRETGAQRRARQGKSDLKTGLKGFTDTLVKGARGLGNVIQTGAQQVGGAARNIEDARQGTTSTSTPTPKPSPAPRSRGMADIRGSSSPGSSTPRKTADNLTRFGTNSRNLPASAAKVTAPGASTTSNIDKTPPASAPKTTPSAAAPKAPKFTPQTGNKTTDMQTWAKANPSLASKVKPGQSGYSAINKPKPVASSPKPAPAPKPVAKPAPKPSSTSRIDAATNVKADPSAFKFSEEIALITDLYGQMYNIEEGRAESNKANELLRIADGKAPKTKRQLEKEKVEKAKEEGKQDFEPAETTTTTKIPEDEAHTAATMRYQRSTGGGGGRASGPAGGAGGGRSVGSSVNIHGTNKHGHNQRKPKPKNESWEAAYEAWLNG